MGSVSRGSKWGQRGMIGGMVRAKREIEIERNNARFHQIFFPGISYLKNK